MLLNEDITQLCALNFLGDATATFLLKCTVLYPGISLGMLLSLKMEYIIDLTNAILWYISTPVI